MAGMESVSSNPSSSADEEGKDEWEVESSETGRCYTSNCQCWVVSTNGGRERRRDAYLLEGSQILAFYPNHRYTPQVKFLGTFSSPLTDIEDWVSPDWFEDLVIPSEDMMYIPPPPPPSPTTSTISLPLFSLTRFIRVPPPVDENGQEWGAGAKGVVGVSYSLPLHPPPSKLIPSRKHPLPTTALDAEMIGSCNGLYCLLSGPVPFPPVGKEEASVIVWNPTTGLSRPLPPFRCSERRNSPIFGFGYDGSTDDYKVVKIDADTRLVEVFSLYSNSNSNSNSWRSVQGLPQNICNIRWGLGNGAVSFAGCLNWLVFTDQVMVASFDLATERFRFHSAPVSLRGSPSLSILDGYLSFAALLHLSPESDVSRSMCACRVLDIWLMREYGVESSWTHAASVAFPHPVHTPFRILYLSKDVLILASDHSMLLVFNLKENTLVCPHIRGAMDTGTGVEAYVQSQVSPYARLSPSLHCPSPN